MKFEMAVQTLNILNMIANLRTMTTQYEGDNKDKDTIYVQEKKNSTKLSSEFISNKHYETLKHTHICVYIYIIYISVV